VCDHRLHRPSPPFRHCGSLPSHLVTAMIMRRCWVLEPRRRKVSALARAPRVAVPATTTTTTTLTQTPEAVSTLQTSRSTLSGCVFPVGIGTLSWFLACWCAQDRRRVQRDHVQTTCLVCLGAYPGRRVKAIFRERIGVASRTSSRGFGV